MLGLNRSYMILKTGHSLLLTLFFTYITPGFWDPLSDKALWQASCSSLLSIGSLEGSYIGCASIICIHVIEILLFRAIVILLFR